MKITEPIQAGDCVSYRYEELFGHKRGSLIEGTGYVIRVCGTPGWFYVAALPWEQDQAFWVAITENEITSVHQGEGLPRA